MPFSDLIVYGLWVLMATAAAWDALNLRIPNFISLCIILLFALHVAYHWNTIALLSHLVSGGLVLAAGMVLFSLRWWGGGDAKLAFSGALWFPLHELHLWILIMSLGGALLAIIVFGTRRLVPEARTANLPVIFRRRGPLPYGIAIAIATIAGTTFIVGR